MPAATARCSISPPRSSCTASSSALQRQNAIAFKEALRGIDVLVIDDLQFLQGKIMQAEFCHTLNALIDAGRQVVIAADRPPSDLETSTTACARGSPAGSWSRWARSAKNCGSKS